MRAGAPPGGGESAPHETRLPVLGIATRFSTNSPAILEAVEAAYGGWRTIAGAAELISDSPTLVRLLLVEDVFAPGAAAGPEAFRHRTPDPMRLFVHSPDAMGVADAGRLESVGYTGPGLLERPEDLAESLLEPLTLFLLCRQDREPLHAAAVLRGGTAILLAGPSGTGKSSLTYAASRRGFEVLADEPVFIQLRPRLRVWGRRPRLHLPIESGRRHFPEIAGLPATRLPSGKRKIVVGAGAGERRWAERVGLCLLARDGRSRPSLETMTPERAVADLTRHLDPGFDLYAATIAERIAAVAERGAWRLRLGEDPFEAVPLLDRIAAEIEAGPA